MLTVLSLGCGADDAPNESASTTDVIDSDASQTTADVNRDSGVVTLTGAVFDARSAAPLVGATVCVGGQEVCVQTGPSGAFALSTAGGATSLFVTASEYRPSVMDVDVEEGLDLAVAMLTQQFWSEQQIATGAIGDAGILAHFVGIDTTGAYVSLSAASLQLASDGDVGLGAIYDLVEAPRVGGLTSDDGLALMHDLAEGAYTALASHAEGACFPKRGTHSGSLTVNVRGGHLSVVIFECLVTVYERVEISGVLVSHGNGAPVMGADVCVTVDEQEACVISNNNGAFSLESLLPLSDAVLEVRSPEFTTTRMALNTLQGRMVTQALTPVDTPRVTLPVPADPTIHGDALLYAYDQETIAVDGYTEATLQPGVSFLVMPTSGSGPHYRVDDVHYSAAVPATFSYGEAVVTMLPAGLYSGRFSHPWGPCVPGHGVAHEADGTFSFRVEADTETRLTAECDVEPPEVVNLIGQVLDGFDNATPVANAFICLIEEGASDPSSSAGICTTSNEYGIYELSGVPANTVIWLSTDAPGYRNSRTLMNTRYGLTYGPRLMPSQAETYFVQPLIAMGLCEEISDFDTLDGTSWFATRGYDEAQMNESFYQGVTLDRMRASLIHVKTGLAHGAPLVNDKMVYFDPTGMFDLKLDEASSNGAIGWCDLIGGDEYHIHFSHPFGSCTVGQGLVPDLDDGGYTFRVYPGQTLLIGAQCAVTPPGSLVEELSTHEGFASMTLLLESAGMMEMLTVPPGMETWLAPYERLTVLAPSDSALSAFLLEHGELDAQAKEALIMNHLIQGELEVHDLVSDAPHWTLGGKPIRFVEDDAGEIRVEGTGAKVTAVEHWSLDGVIYVIDQVLEPAEVPGSALVSVTTSNATAAHIDGLQLSHDTWASGAASYPTYTVYTPPGYYDTLPEGYPVIYALHDVGGDDLSVLGGKTMGQQAASGLHQVVETLVNTGNLAPMIVVGVNGMSHGYGSYFITSILENGSPAFGDFQSYLMGIITEVEATYNTATSPEGPQNRALLGVGMGGFGALHSAAAHPMFSAVVVHSGLLSLADLLSPDATVAANYAAGEVDGSLISEVLAVWEAAHGTTALDGRLVELVGPGQPEVIARLVAMATAFSPILDTLYEFDMMSTSKFFTGSAPPDEDPSDNRHYPMVLHDAKDVGSDLDDEMLGFTLPWTAVGEIDSDIWELWAAHEPLTALQSAADALVAADTDFYIDAGLSDERGFADQVEGFVALASLSVGPEQFTLDLYQGDHDSLVYTERFYTSMMWLGTILAEEAVSTP
jgi:enterochelin esterase-like enzyme